MREEMEMESSWKKVARQKSGLQAKGLMGLCRRRKGMKADSDEDCCRR